MDVKRQKIEEKRKAQDLREFLSRQHRLKLLAKTSQVQKDLDQDRKLLDEMTVFLETADASGIEERDEKNQRLTWLQNVIDLQKTEEIQRQKEMEMLFSEEAEKMWKKQEKVWKREEDARRHLMEDVLAGLKEQIRAKLQGMLNIFLSVKVLPFSYTQLNLPGKMPLKLNGQKSPTHTGNSLRYGGSISVAYSLSDIKSHEDLTNSARKGKKFLHQKT